MTLKEFLVNHKFTRASFVEAITCANLNPITALITLHRVRRFLDGFQDFTPTQKINIEKFTRGLVTPDEITGEFKNTCDRLSKYDY